MPKSRDSRLTGFLESPPPFLQNDPRRQNQGWKLIWVLSFFVIVDFETVQERFRNKSETTDGSRTVLKRLRNASNGLSTVPELPRNGSGMVPRRFYNGFGPKQRGTGPTSPTSPEISFVKRFFWHHRYNSY